MKWSAITEYFLERVINILGVILVSHGNFAVEALKSVEMIAGKQELVHAYAMVEDCSLDQLLTNLRAGIKDLEGKVDYIVAICDIYGGTPCNALMRLKLEGNEMEAFTGLNLAMLIDLCLSKETLRSEIAIKLQDTCMKAFSEIKPAILEDNDSINEL